jgi:hypothetical protein
MSDRIVSWASDRPQPGTKSSALIGMTPNVSPRVSSVFAQAADAPAKRGCRS